LAQVVHTVHNCRPIDNLPLSLAMGCGASSTRCNVHGPREKNPLPALPSDVALQCTLLSRNSNLMKAVKGASGECPYEAYKIDGFVAGSEFLKGLKLEKGEEVIVYPDMATVKEACDRNGVGWSDQKETYIASLKPQDICAVGESDWSGEGIRVFFRDGRWWSFPLEVLAVRLASFQPSRRQFLLEGTKEWVVWSKKVTLVPQKDSTPSFHKNEDGDEEDVPLKRDIPKTQKQKRKDVSKSTKNLQNVVQKATMCEARVTTDELAEVPETIEQVRPSLGKKAPKTTKKPQGKSYKDLKNPDSVHKKAITARKKIKNVSGDILDELLELTGEQDDNEEPEAEAEAEVAAGDEEEEEEAEGPAEDEEEEGEDEEEEEEDEEDEEEDEEEEED